MRGGRSIVWVAGAFWLLSGCSGASVDSGGDVTDVLVASDAPSVPDVMPADVPPPADVKPLPEDVPAAPDIPATSDIPAVLDVSPDIPEDVPVDVPVDAVDIQPDVPEVPDVVDTWEEDVPELVCDGLPRAVEWAGDLLEGVPVRMRPFQPCSEQRFYFQVAEGSTVAIELHPFAAMGELQAVVAYPDTALWDEPLANIDVPPGDTASIEFQPPRSGEFVLLLRTADPESSGVYDVRMDCVAGCERETTRFPVVMVHGWTGWADVAAYDYFYEVPGTVRDRGYQVFIASLDPYNSIDVRSGQLAEQLETFLVEARARKVNFIAHSQGGLDCRRVISTLGYADRVSSLTTVSTPHHGTELTDVALGLLPGFGEDILAALLEWLGATVVGSESDAIASFESMTTGYVRDVFNPANPNHPDVDYISYAGRTCLYGISCGDMCDIEIRWAYDVLIIAAGENDGIVPVDSAIWGDYRGEIPADHFDEVGQLFGVTNANFEHRSWYLERFRDLAAEGH